MLQDISHPHKEYQKSAHGKDIDIFKIKPGNKYGKYPGDNNTDNENLIFRHVLNLTVFNRKTLILYHAWDYI